MHRKTAPTRCVCRCESCVLEVDHVLVQWIVNHSLETRQRTSERLVAGAGKTEADLDAVIHRRNLRTVSNMQNNTRRRTSLCFSASSWMSITPSGEMLGEGRASCCGCFLSSGAAAAAVVSLVAAVAAAVEVGPVAGAFVSVVACWSVAVLVSVADAGAAAGGSPPACLSS